MAKTPIGDILPYNNIPVYAIADTAIILYGFKNGVAGLTPVLNIPKGQIVGYCDGWFENNTNIFLIFYRNISDYNNQQNPYYFRYSDFKKISFPTVATWKKEGINFGAVSTRIQNIIDRDAKESETLTSILSGTANKLILITAVYFGFKLLTNGNK